MVVTPPQLVPSSRRWHRVPAVPGKRATGSANRCHTHHQPSTGRYATIHPSHSLSSDGRESRGRGVESGEVDGGEGASGGDRERGRHTFTLRESEIY